MKCDILFALTILHDANRVTLLIDLNERSGCKENCSAVRSHCRYAVDAFEMIENKVSGEQKFKTSLVPTFLSN